MTIFRNVSHHNSLLRFISSRLSKFKGHFPEVVVLSNLLSSLFFDCPETTDLVDDPFWIFVGSKRGRRAREPARNENDSWFPLEPWKRRWTRWTLLVRTIAGKSKKLLVCHPCAAKTAGDPFKSSVAQLVDRSNASSFSSRMTRNCAAFFSFG